MHILHAGWHRHRLRLHASDSRMVTSFDVQRIPQKTLCLKTGLWQSALPKFRNPGASLASVVHGIRVNWVIWANSPGLGTLAKLCAYAIQL